MTIVVGYPPSRRAKAVLNLAAMLARSSGEDLVVCTVVPAPWLPGMTRVDAEYQAYLDDVAERALDRARADLPADVHAEFTVQRARSTPSGLLEVTERHQATVIVLGSSTAGMFGYVALSSVADRLLHSSPVPVALATRGFRSGAGDKVTRVTVAYGGSEQADRLVAATRLVVSRMGAALRLASFAVQPPPPDTALMRVEADDIVATWAAGIRETAEQALADHGADAPVAGPLEVVVGRGEDWGEALEDIDWEHGGDLLVVGSSSAGPLARVFLGSRATKIVRQSPVPVVVVPRAAAGVS